MALTSKQKKQGAAVSAAIGVLALGGVAVSTLGSGGAAVDRPVAAAAVQQAAVAPQVVAGVGESVGGIAVVARVDNAKLADDTVFTVSGEVKGAKPGTKVRLQRKTSGKSATGWTTLAYTTFTDTSNKFSFPVKMDSSGSYTLRILHPQDKEGPATVYSSPFSVTVSAPAKAATSSKASKTSMKKN